MGPVSAVYVKTGVGFAVAGGVARFVIELIRIHDIFRYAKQSPLIVAAIISNALVLATPVMLLSSARLRMDQRWTGVTGAICGAFGAYHAANSIISGIWFGFESGKPLVLNLASLAGSAALMTAGGLLLRYTFARR